MDSPCAVGGSRAEAALRGTHSQAALGNDRVSALEGMGGFVPVGEAPSRAWRGRIPKQRLGTTGGTTGGDRNVFGKVDKFSEKWYTPALFKALTVRR